MQENYKEIIAKFSKKVVDQYKKTKNVLGIFIIGSAARSTFDKYSDIDFFIVLAKRVNIGVENFLPGLILMWKYFLIP